MHKADAARLKRQVPKMAKAHQCKVNGDFMHEARSNEFAFKMLNGKECNANVYCCLTECQYSIFVNKMKKVSVLL